MDIQLHVWPEGTRTCLFSLCLQDASAFADFDRDASGLLYVVRISFDGYGCCHVPADKIGRMARADSEVLLAMVSQNAFDAIATPAILRRYFRQNQNVIWSDALEQHELI